MTSPISNIATLAIGTVESVSPDEITVLLDVDSPRNTALNTGVPTPFPRINSFVLLPNESGSVVGIVVWLGLEKSTYPKRQGYKDADLIDLPFPLRKMTVCPIGTLLSENNKWRIERGVQSYPSVGDHVILPSRDQAAAIVTGHGKDSRVPLGTCPIAHDAPISIDPDKLFGRHLAVLGNTGSGKSCTLAALLRSAIESAQNNYIRPKASKNRKKNNLDHSGPNARFIVLDPNGEYSKCFQDLGSKCRVFKIPPFKDIDAKNFTLPAWLWNSSEWSAIAQAASKAQRPILQEALRNIRAGSTIKSDGLLDLRLKLLQAMNVIRPFARIGTSPQKDKFIVGDYLSKFCIDIEDIKENISGKIINDIDSLSYKVEEILDKNKNGSYYQEFTGIDIRNIIEKINLVKKQIRGDSKKSVSEDAPIYFDPKNLPDHLDVLANLQGQSSVSYLSTLVMRIRTFLSDDRIKDVILTGKEPDLCQWLESTIGADGAGDGPVAVIDLSLVPYDILHLVIAVSSRLILESLQRYKKCHPKQLPLPTVLVLEEAHTFVSRRLPHDDEFTTPAEMCRGIFERIAREGRKFGLGLVLSSQRPSELSETVLSQCNSLLLHRITNDRDQELVSRLVPDNSRGLLRELPSLPTSHCILMGIASQIPTLVKVGHLREDHRPKSTDPDFWNVWTNNATRTINWDMIVKDWDGTKPIGLSTEKVKSKK